MTPALRVSIGASANSSKFIVGLHSLAMVSLLLALISGWQRLILLLLVLASAIWHLTRPRRVSQLIYLPDSGWRCQNQSGEYSAWYEMRRSLLWHSLIVVYLVNETESNSLVIWRDAVTESDYRRLSVLLTDVRTYRQ
jgi:hypothetical protein